MLDETNADGAAVKRAVSFRAWEVKPSSRTSVPHSPHSLHTPLHTPLHLGTRDRCCGMRVIRILRSSGLVEGRTTCDRSPQPSSLSTPTTRRVGRQRSGAPAPAPARGLAPTRLELESGATPRPSPTPTRSPNQVGRAREGFARKRAGRRDAVRHGRTRVGDARRRGARGGGGGGGSVGGGARLSALRPARGGEGHGRRHAQPRHGALITAG